jgi:hypothetical protein
MKHLSQYFTERLNIQPLNEGGASGHMLHPYDVDEFTGYDIEELIRTMFGGKMEGMTEKMDGFGMQASMNNNGEVIFIRNKGNLNSEKGGMTLDDFATQWAENPKALDNYTRGGKIIEAVFKKVGKDWFNPSSTKRLVVNCECILAGTTNTIPYASDQVDFHNIWIYEKQESDSEWKNIEVTKRGLDVIEKACNGIDNAKITPQVIIKYSEETARLEKKWLDEWSKFLKTYDCAPDVTIEGIKYSLFFKWTDKNAWWLMDDYKAAQDVCRRWIFNDKSSSNLRDLKDIYKDHLDKFVTLDKHANKVCGEVLYPLQKFFYGMGADVIKVTSGFINDGQDGTIKSLLKDLQTATDKIRREGSLEDNEFLQKWLDVLKEIGEENLASAEGIVFSYKGKMMKWTGGFVPLNRIIGYSKYNMKPKSLTESLFGDNIKKKLVPEKLAYVLKKFFGNDVALCEDHQGSTKWYEVNPFAMNAASSPFLNSRIVNYCKKVDGLEIKQDTLPSFGTVKGYRIGDDTYWMYLNTMKYGERMIKVSKEFYESGILPQNQKGITQRGWREWQKQRL